MNNLSVAEQIAQLRNIIRTRPWYFAVLVVLALIGIVFNNHEPTLWRFTATLADSGREIETLLIANPNVEKRDVLVRLAPDGQTSDLGIDQSTALDLETKGPRLGRLSVAERSISVLSLLRKQTPQPPSVRAVPPAVEAVSNDAILRQLALSYLIGLMLYVQSFIKELTFGWAVFTALKTFAVSNPRQWIESLRSPKRPDPSAT